MDTSSGSGCPMQNTSASSSTTSTESVSQFPSANYLALYRGFTDYNDENNPSAACIIQENANSADTSDFIAVGGTDMMVKSAQYGNALIPFRKSDVPGFTELTSISHIPPCMAYFANALLRYPTDTRIQTQIANFYSSLESVRDDFGWLDSLTSGVYYNHADKIKEMFNFATTDCMAFLESCLENGTYSFDQADVINWFGLTNEYDENDSRSNLWKGIMVGTFSLIVADGIDTLTSDSKVSETVDCTYREFLSAINWPKAEALFCGQIGAVSSGLDMTTNSTYKAVSAIAQYFNSISETPDTSYTGFNRHNCFFAPYVDPSSWTLTTDNTMEDALSYFKSQFNNLNNRVEISALMFNNIRIDGATVEERIDTLYANTPSIESMVTVDTSNNPSEMALIDGLTRRMAFCMEDYRDTLSDCVTSCVCELWKNTGYDLTKVNLPGLGLTYPVSVLV